MAPKPMGTAASFVQISGVDFDDFISDLRDAQQGLAKEKRRANREVAEVVATTARARASAGTKLERHYASAIQARSTQYVARIGLSTSAKNWGANTAFFGTKRRTGWYAKGKYTNSPAPQFPEWVGIGWPYASRTEGPYVLNAALADVLPKVEELYIDAHERAYKRAFPGGMTA